MGHKPGTGGPGLIRPCASVPTGQAKSGSVPSVPTHEDWVQVFRQVGLGGAHWLGRPSTPGLSSAQGNLGLPLLTGSRWGLGAQAWLLELEGFGEAHNALG